MAPVRGSSATKAALDLRQLRDRPVALGAAHDADDGAGPDLRLRIGLGDERRGRRLQPFAGDRDRLAVLQHRHDLLRRRLGHDRRLQLVVVREVLERVGDARVHLLQVGRQVDVVLGAAIDLAPLVVEDALAQGPVGQGLLAGIERQPDVEAAGVGLGTVLVEDHLPGLLGHVLGMHRHLRRRAVAQHLLQRRVVLLGGDEAVVEHAVDDVALADRRPLGIDDRVVRRRRLRQPGEHRRLGDGDVLERLAEIDLAGRGEAERALAERNMVHVDLENLLLGQQAFDLQRKQHLVDFASKCFFRRQIEIARDLHRDRRCALRAARLAEVGQTGADHAHVVDAAVLIELRVLGGEHRVLHHLRDLADRHEVAPLLAELAQEHAVGGEHAHRQLRPVVGEAADLGEIGIADGERDAGHEDHRDDRGRGEAEQSRDDAQQDLRPGGQRRCGAPAARGASAVFAVGFAHTLACIEGSL